MFVLSCFMLSGCQISAGTSLESSALTPTGYASEEMQRISVFYDGSLYLYSATGFDLPKEDDWEFLGQVVSVNDFEWPSEDFAGTHLNIGQEIYWEPSEPQKLYIKYDNGFALFEAEETKKEESTEYLDYVTAGIKLWTSDSLELKLTNVSNETISYGEAFTMEILHDGIWEKLPVLSEDYGFHDISYELEPEEYRFIDIDFAWLYGELREGWFRIIKEIYLQDGTVYSVPAEFGDLDFRQSEIVNSFGNPKEVLDEMSITSNSNRVIKWFDFLNGDEMVSDDIKECNLEEFSEVTFRWSYTALEAVTDEETVSLYTGMPIWSVYFYDLTGDGHSDICSTISCGSGMVDNRIIIYDYIEGAGYVLSDRGNFDYVLNMQEDSLVAEKRAYNQDEIIESGKLIFLDDKIQIKTE